MKPGEMSMSDSLGDCGYQRELARCEWRIFAEDDPADRASSD